MTLVFILIHVLMWVLPLAVLIAVPAFVIIRVVRFAKSEASTGRKVFVVTGAVVAVPVLLIACLFLTQAIQIGGLKLIARAVRVEDKTTSESVERQTPP